MRRRGDGSTGVAQGTVCSAQKMAVAMDGDGSTGSVRGHGYWRLGSAAVNKDVGANRVAAAQGAGGYRCGRNNDSVGATATVTQGLVVVCARLVQVVVEARVTQGFAMGGRI